MTKKPKILVVSHDAGGANILSSLVKKYRQDFDWSTCLAGPAKEIFLRKKIDLYTAWLSSRGNNPESILKSSRPDFLLTGTSWESNFEINFIKSAKKNKIKTGAFIDHWANYRERFGYPDNWTMNLPDFIFVGDKWAYKIARENGFPKRRLLEVENPYFEEIIRKAQEIKQKLKEARRGNTLRILYVSQPISWHALKKHHQQNYWGYTEYDILKDLLEILLEKKLEKPLSLKIRLHPAEKVGKYSSLLKNKCYTTIRRAISASNPAVNSLIDDCLWADVAIGAGSMALVIAFMIGKKAICYMPESKHRFSFPHKEIKTTVSLDKLISEIKKTKKGSHSFIRKDHRSKERNPFKKVIDKIIDEC